MFKFDNINLLFEPKVGDELILNGKVSIYSPTGRYQFNVKHIEVSGEGALLRAFEDLKYIGGTYGAIHKPCKFICLLLKML